MDLKSNLCIRTNTGSIQHGDHDDRRPGGEVLTPLSRTVAMGARNMPSMPRPRERHAVELVLWPAKQPQQQ